MGFRLIAQITLILAAFVILFSFIQPSLGKMKVKQDELYQYSEAVSKASQFNARLGELITIRDSFSPEDLTALEKLLPTKIDQMEVMRSIETIFNNRAIPIQSLTAEDPVTPATDIAVESPVIIEQQNGDLSYQDFKVSFSGTYWQLRDVLLLAEMNDALLEVVELNFGVPIEANQDDINSSPVVTDNSGDQHQFSITFRTYGLPVKSI